VYAAACYALGGWWAVRQTKHRYKSGTLDRHFAVEEFVFWLLSPILVPITVLGRLAGMGSPL
jgi:hypothetical protein